jgi:hypothetical protein
VLKLDALVARIHATVAAVVGSGFGLLVILAGCMPVAVVTAATRV